jgi:hypothetical protein
MTKDEKLQYAKGYAAGRKRGQQDVCPAAIRAANAKLRAADRFWQQAYLTALNATIQAQSWESAGKKWSNGQMFAQGCANLADVVLREAQRRGKI